MKEEYNKIKSWLLQNGYNNYDVMKVTIDNIAHTVESYLQHKAKIIGESNSQANVSGNEALLEALLFSSWLQRRNVGIISPKELDEYYEQYKEEKSNDCHRSAPCC